MYVGVRFSDDEELYEVCHFLDEEAEKEANNDPKSEWSKELRDYHPAGNNVVVMTDNTAKHLEANNKIIPSDRLDFRRAEELSDEEISKFIRKRYRALYHSRTL